MDAGGGDKPARSKTFLQRAFQAFETVKPAPLSARGLAAVLNTEPSTAYNYIARLKRMKKIEEVGGGRFPSYGLCPGATPPPSDTRGRKPSRAETSETRWKPIKR